MLVVSMNGYFRKMSDEYISKLAEMVGVLAST
jgi:hypothetical protein